MRRHSEKTVMMDGVKGAEILRVAQDDVNEQDDVAG